MTPIFRRGETKANFCYAIAKMNKMCQFTIYLAEYQGSKMHDSFDDLTLFIVADKGCHKHIHTSWM